MFTLKFLEGYQCQQKAPEEGSRIQWLKPCEYSNEDEDNNLNHVNYEVSFSKISFPKKF